MTTAQRKRKRAGHTVQGDPKRQKLAGTTAPKSPVVKDAVLASYYLELLSLRQYLLSKLPPCSKRRKKKLLSVGHSQNEDDERFAAFLDETLIGVSKNEQLSSEDIRKQWTTFSQKADDSTSLLTTNMAPIFSQSEIVDFAIWLLFSKPESSNWKCQHLLCQGFRRDRSQNRTEESMTLPGIISTYPNNHVTEMKTSPWPRILALLGRDGEIAMVELIMMCGIFRPITSGRGSYNQLSGYPLGDLQALESTSSALECTTVRTQCRRIPRAPASITFVRSRILYARATLNTRGKVRFGFSHAHVLNRSVSPTKYASDSDIAELSGETYVQSTAQVMMYMFPRQFGLHNVFTHEINPQQTVQPFHDYTVRDDEIYEKYLPSVRIKLPRRLRGPLPNLVRKLQIQHSSCPYSALLQYYCPAHASVPPRLIASGESMKSSEALRTQVLETAGFPEERSDGIRHLAAVKAPTNHHATPTSSVSAFCRAVLTRLIPLDFWGGGKSQKHNMCVLMRNVDLFLRLRRFETITLHAVTQGVKITEIDWLAPPGLTGKKMSETDKSKRWEIFLEFAYYIFDSLLIPLIRAHFHVTDSNVHRYQLFYYRHDVWRALTEPVLASLKLTMFEEVKLETAMQILKSRSLGFSQLRLLPKLLGFRPILNLKRRCIQRGEKNSLGKSVNSVLAPVYNILTLEKALHPARLGSTLFSPSDMYAKLRDFGARVETTGKLLFAKVDVQAAFDTIPQKAVLRVISALLSEEEYRISRHAEVRSGDNCWGNNTAKPMRRWLALAHAPDNLDSFEENLENNLAVGRKNTVFVENVVSHFRDKEEILDLLTEHVENNMVKIGKRFYRQQEGIAQGSVVSSLLCNYFYADLETSVLSFLDPKESLLLRLQDDFLLLTINCEHARRFLQIMHDGLPAYGVRVNAQKTLVNFEATINGIHLSRVVGQKAFPFCGSFIDMATLNVTKDRERGKDLVVADSLTVEYSKRPGKTFRNKILSTFQIQAHAMYFDTAFNSAQTVKSNIYSAFTECATKMYTYIFCLPVHKQPGTKLVIKTFEDLVDLAFTLLKNKTRSKKNPGYHFSLSKIQVEWLAVNAFKHVLAKRQSKYRGVIEWLDTRISGLRTKNASACGRLDHLQNDRHHKE